MFPEDKKCNSLFYFPLSTSIMKSYPPGTASNMLNSTSYTSAAQRLPRRRGCDTKRRADQSRGREGKQGQGRARFQPEAIGAPQRPAVPLRSCLQAVSTKANGGRVGLLRYTGGKKIYI